MRPLYSLKVEPPRLFFLVQFGLISARKDLLFDIATSGGVHKIEQIWGRCAVFIIDDKPLLVRDFFQPALFGKI